MAQIPFDENTLNSFVDKFKYVVDDILNDININKIDLAINVLNGFDFSLQTTIQYKGLDYTSIGKNINDIINNDSEIKELKNKAEESAIALRNELRDLKSKYQEAKIKIKEALLNQLKEIIKNVNENLPMLSWNQLRISTSINTTIDLIQKRKEQVNNYIIEHITEVKDAIKNSFNQIINELKPITNEDIQKLFKIVDEKYEMFRKKLKEKYIIDPNTKMYIVSPEFQKHIIMNKIKNIIIFGSPIVIFGLIFLKKNLKRR